MRAYSPRFLHKNSVAVLHFMLTDLCRKAEEKCQLYLHNSSFLMNVSRNIIYRSILDDNIENVVELIMRQSLLTKI